MGSYSFNSDCAVVSFKLQLDSYFCDLFHQCLSLIFILMLVFTWNLASMQVTEMRSSISQIGFDFKQLNEMISGIVSLSFAL